MNTRNSNRFLNPKRLTKDTRVLGATADQWDRALKGNMAQTLEEVKRLAAIAAAKTTSVDSSKNVPLDLASTIHRKRVAR
jgi:hypothetical protein